MQEPISIIAQIVEWTDLKCHIQAASEPTFYFKEREIWWASIGANLGSEQNGKHDLFERPVLVLKKFGPHMLWILPMTTSQKETPYHFRTAFHDKEKQQSADLSQIRTISARRLIRKQRVLPIDEFTEIRRRLREWL